jgi:exodeoxyribonuclease V
MQFTLSTDQQNAKAMLMPVLRRETEHRVALLNGYAGTGKTFLVADMIGDLYRAGDKVLAIAPTHKAKAVIHDKLTRAGIHVDVMTMHSALGISMYDNGIEMVERFTGRTKIVNYRAIVVDEGSMIARRYHNQIVKDAGAVGASVLYVGDLAQLPPVKDDNLSPIFTELSIQAVLSQILRQSVDSFDVPLMGQQIRIAIEQNRRVTIDELKPFKKGVVFASRRDTLDASLSQFNIKTQYAINAIKQGLNAKILTFSNAAAEKCNADMQRYFNADAKKFRVGEPVVFADQFGEEYPNNSEWEVESCSDAIEIEGIECAEVKLRYAKEPVLVPIDLPRWLRELQGLRRDMRQQGSFDVKLIKRTEERIRKLRQFANLRASYAMTVHKSQGSTYDVAIVDWADLEMAQDGELQTFNRLAYVAITRPSQFLVVVQ